MKKIYDLDFVKNFVKNKGFCLSEKYINSNTKMRWKCKCGYEWNATFKFIKNSNSWCKECSDNRKRNSLKDIKDFVKKKHNGKCLSKKYVNNYTKLKWECKKGHVWEATWHSMRHFWCPFCSNQNRTTKEEILNIIGDKGIILKGECDSVAKRLTLKCNCGYIWETCVRSIKIKRWCPKCANKIGPTIEEINEIIKDKGICLKKGNSTEKSTFKCKCGNIFEQRYNVVLAGIWCQVCSSKVNKIDINVVNDFVVKNGGVLLSKYYKNTSSKLQIKCKNDHMFFTNWNNLKGGYWCKYCSERKGEKIARKVLESIFNEKFEKIKPEWLINPKTNQKLELDGYCEKLNIAFEYQGKQHYNIVPTFNMDNKKLAQQQYRDKVKKNICKDKNVCLLEIKYFYKNKPKYIFNNIKETLVKNNIMIDDLVLKEAINQLPEIP